MVGTSCRHRHGGLRQAAGGGGPRTNLGLDLAKVSVELGECGEMALAASHGHAVRQRRHDERRCGIRRGEDGLVRKG